MIMRLETGFTTQKAQFDGWDLGVLYITQLGWGRVLDSWQIGVSINQASGGVYWNDMIAIILKRRTKYILKGSLEMYTKNK